ncbi:MAG TPA: hypothetical protein VMM92_02235, partial [Thermoanaerobaculia bacterium]|nr:hypothetical protein [Thermoanaerobaculia bacterium]
AAQELYWAKASELYRHLGDPRDYMPAIEWEEARTERRVRRSAATEPRAAPAARAAATVPARAPLAARPMPARPARIAASVPELQRMLERWNRERQGSYRAQAEKTSLELETQAMRQTLEREARNTLLKSGERQALEAARNRLARELAWQSYAVRREGRQLAEIVGRAYEAAKEKAFWKLMTRSVGKLLGEPAGADRLAAHCVWVLRSYREMLDGTLPRAAELLGTGAAPEDQAEYERLSLLGQRKPEDWAREVFQIKRQDLPLEAGSDAAP